MEIKYSKKTDKQSKKIKMSRQNLDRLDYYSAIEVKKKNKKWTTHDELKKKLGL